METKQTAVSWLVEELMKTNLKISSDGLTALSTKALEMEADQIHETKQRWFGKGVLADRENKIAELKPIRKK